VQRVCSKRAACFREISRRPHARDRVLDPTAITRRLLQDNILFGKIAYGEADAISRIR